MFIATSIYSYIHKYICVPAASAALALPPRNNNDNNDDNNNTKHNTNANTTNTTKHDYNHSNNINKYY